MQTNTVAEILGCRSWEGQHGTLYFHKLKMSDGVVAEVAKKRENAFTVGQELTYELEEAVNKATGEGYWKLKEVKEFGGGGKGGGRAFSDPKTMLCAYAKDIVVACIEQGQIQENFFEEVIRGATMLTKWYEGSPAIEQQQEQPETEFHRDEMRDAMPVPTWPPPQPQNQPQNAPAHTGTEPARTGKAKPQFGGVREGGKAPSAPQQNLLHKVAAEKGININQMIAEEWSDITDASQLSSWATSYLLDRIFGNV